MAQDKTSHEKLVQLHKRLAAASQADRELYQRQIDATDREIDRLVASRELPQGADGRRDRGG